MVVPRCGECLLPERRMAITMNIITHYNNHHHHGQYNHRLVINLMFYYARDTVTYGCLSEDTNQTIDCVRMF